MKQVSIAILGQNLSLRFIWQLWEAVTKAQQANSIKTNPQFLALQWFSSVLLSVAATEAEAKENKSEEAVPQEEAGYFRDSIEHETI